MTTLDTPASDATNEELPWHLRENRAPVFDEVTLTDLEVRGAIPPELSGRYLRNGANPQTGQSEHWFLGDGMIHGIELADGKANWYRNRYVRTPMFANPGVERMDLYLDPETFQFNFEVGVANTHVIEHAGRILALEEGSFPYQIDCNLDQGRNGTYTLSVTLPGGTVKTFEDLPYGNGNFRIATWIGIISAGKHDGRFHVDSLICTTSD